jgi:hypothetical protein
MPLTRKGKSVKRKFQRRYGKRGTSVFYATMNRRPKLRRKLKRSPRRKRRR